jgi:pimeloyl-ACP methyl ester carboxylesterase
MSSDRGSRTTCCLTILFLRRVALVWAVGSASWGGYQSSVAATNQVVLFTGFLAGPGPGNGMDFLSAQLASAIPDYLGQVFEWDQHEEAFDWVEQNTGDRATLVLIGHSFGGSSTLQLANDYLKPINLDVDLTIQIDPVQNFIPGARNDVLPTNVDVGFNYYQISTSFFEPQGEDFVQGATNINAEILYNDTTITHTSIDNDSRLFASITQNILGNLNVASADFDLDGDVNGRDFLAWQRGESPTSLSAVDLALWQEEYGNPQLSAVTMVPEPSSLLLVSLSGGVWFFGFARPLC